MIWLVPFTILLFRLLVSLFWCLWKEKENNDCGAVCWCSHTVSDSTIFKWFFGVLLNVLPLVTCCLLYLLRTRLIKEFCSFSHSSCSCGVPLLQFQKTHFLQEEAARAKERKEVTSSSCGNHPFSSKFYPPPQKLYCNGSSHAGVFLYLYLYLLHRWQEEGSPCSSSHARGICRPWSCRSRQENRPGLARLGKRQEARKHRRSKVQSGPMQESVSPQSRQETLQNKQKMTSKKNRQRTYCKSAVRVALQCDFGDFGKQVEILISIPTSLTSFQLQYYIRGWG